MTRYHYRAGDEVLHKPSGETWKLACDEENGRVLIAGYPSSSADVNDLALINRATPGDRLRMLKTAAKSTGARAARAKVQLDAMGIRLGSEVES